jgi:hypothetical protein
MTGYHFRLVFASRDPSTRAESGVLKGIMDLALVLQRLYEISLTITMLPDGGFDFALISYMEWEELGRPIDYMTMIASAQPLERPPGPDPWHNVEHADELASAIHEAALGKYPDSEYAKLYARPN